MASFLHLATDPSAENGHCVPIEHSGLHSRLWRFVKRVRAHHVRHERDSFLFSVYFMSALARANRSHLPFVPYRRRVIKLEGSGNIFLFSFHHLAKAATYEMRFTKPTQFFVTSFLENFLSPLRRDSRYFPFYIHVYSRAIIIRQLTCL